MNLSSLERWYASQCNGDWEHSYGIHIDTLDNPGWKIKIDLHATRKQNCSLQRQIIAQSQNDWIQYWIEKEQFHVACGPLNLYEAVEIFIRWFDSDNTRLPSLSKFARAALSNQLNHHPLPHQGRRPLPTRQRDIAFRIENAIHLRPARLGVPHPCRVLRDRACPELVEGVGTLTRKFTSFSCSRAPAATRPLPSADSPCPPASECERSSQDWLFAP